MPLTMETNDVVIQVRSDKDCTTVFLKGDLDLYSVPAVRPRIQAAADDFTGDEFQVDLTEVPFIDSAGLALLLTLRKVPTLDGRLTIVVASESHPERVLRLTRIDSFMRLTSQQPAE